VSRGARGEQGGAGGEFSFMNDVEGDQRLIPSIGGAYNSFLFGGRHPVGRAVLMHRELFACVGVVFKNHDSRFINRLPPEKL